MSRRGCRWADTCRKKSKNSTDWLAWAIGERKLDYRNLKISLLHPFPKGHPPLHGASLAGAKGRASFALGVLDLRIKELGVICNFGWMSSDIFIFISMSQPAGLSQNNIRFIAEKDTQLLNP